MELVGDFENKFKNNGVYEMLREDLYAFSLHELTMTK